MAASSPKRRVSILPPDTPPAADGADTARSPGPPPSKADMAQVATLARATQRQRRRESDDCDTMVSSDLGCLPRRVRETCFEHAREKLGAYVVPIVKLRSRRRFRSSVDTAPDSQKLTVELLRKQRLFSEWPESMVAEVIAEMRLFRYGTGEYLFYDGEPGILMLVLLSGHVEVLRNQPGKAATVERTHSAVHVLGDSSVLTEERWMQSIRTTRPAVCAMLMARTFQRFLPRLPVAVFTSSMEFAFKQRREAIASAPPEPQDFESCRLFNGCPLPFLERLQKWSSPLVVPKGYALAKTGVAPEHIFLLLSGRCHHLRPEDDNAPEQSGIVEAKAVINSVAVFSATKSTETVTALSTCDLWVLAKSQFEECLLPGMVDRMLETVRRLREEELKKCHGLFRRVVNRIPLMRTVCGSERYLHGIETLFDARIYKAHTLICSRSAPADKVMVLLKGTVTVRAGFGSNPRLWPPGESVGWTCIIPHRWTLSALSQSATECLEIPRERFVRFLERNGGLGKVYRWARALMFPCSTPDEEFSLVEDLTADVTLRMYPVSARGSLCRIEWGFVGVGAGSACSPPSSPRSRAAAAALQPVPPRAGSARRDAPPRRTMSRLQFGTDALQGKLHAILIRHDGDRRPRGGRGSISAGGAAEHAAAADGVARRPSAARLDRLYGRDRYGVPDGPGRVVAMGAAHVAALAGAAAAVAVRMLFPLRHAAWRPAGRAACPPPSPRPLAPAARRSRTAAAAPAAADWETRLYPLDVPVRDIPSRPKKRQVVYPPVSPYAAPPPRRNCRHGIMLL
eukprot:TRINITY_DN51163_c0_g1_i1.p1 TRINITY_DN51163_c0_g1~~TRINITY_DN51163_c0_g1_i1.p1  ORF type:complete len:797 (+),score=206.21 TRINITY_DN51163_c0_g1_i1:93-2483(+)